MAVQSMTGFGRAEAEVLGLRYSVEIRSINHRHLDLKQRLPRALAPLEAQLAGCVRRSVHRGRVELTVSCAAAEEGHTQTALNRGLVSELFEAYAQLGDHLHDLWGAQAGAAGLGAPSGLDFWSPSALADHIARQPGVFQTTVRSVDEAQLRAAIVPAIEAALAQLQQSRAQEGAVLRESLRGFLAALRAGHQRLRAQAPQQVVAWREKLKARMAQALAELSVQIDEERIAHEAALFAERTDVTEEFDRLEAHFASAEQLLEAGGEGGVGRTLDFLCQEILREINTIGSKVQAIEMTAEVIEMKAQLERFREQVQNIE